MLNTASDMESSSNQERESSSTHTIPTTKAQRIRVQNSKSGYATLPHGILREVMKFSGKKSSVFVYIWERTVSFRNFQREMDVEEIMGFWEYWILLANSFWYAMREGEPPGEPS